VAKTSPVEKMGMELLIEFPISSRPQMNVGVHFTDGCRHQIKKEFQMIRMSRLAGVSIVALLLFAFPKMGPSADWLEEYIAAAAISAAESMESDNPNKPTIEAFLRLRNAEAENQGTFNGQTYMPLEGME
jgi:hypothetical protein